ncbi:MAG: hypothetical protein AB4063_01135 [Crocosphaera sp.]
MSYSQPPSNNRLLELEQELLGKKRLTEARQGKQNITYGKKDQTSRIDNKPHTNNRLLELELELLGRYSSKKTNQKASGRYSLRVEEDNSDRRISHRNNRLLELEKELLEEQRQPKKQKRKSKRSQIKSQVFDTGEAITLEYNSEVYLISAPKTTIISTSETEFLVTPPPVLSNSESLENISPEDQKSLSQATEVISEIEPTFNHLQAEDIPLIPAEFNTEREKKSAKLISLKEESRHDQNNPHAIFDRMGNNMAYATTFDVGTIELEKLFDDFDSTLDQEEQVNQSHSFSQKQDNLELEQRFDQFDRALELEEQLNNSDSIAENNYPSEILWEKMDIETEEPEDIEREETDIITSKLATKAIENQNQSSIIAPLEIQQPKLTQPLSLASELDTQNIPEFDLNLKAFIFRSGLNIISLIVWLINLVCRNQINFNSEIKLKSASLPISHGNQENTPQKTSNDKI